MRPGRLPAFACLDAHHGVIRPFRQGKGVANFSGFFRRTCKCCKVQDVASVTDLTAGRYPGSAASHVGHGKGVKVTPRFGVMGPRVPPWPAFFAALPVVQRVTAFGGDPVAEKTPWSGPIPETRTGGSPNRSPSPDSNPPWPPHIREFARRFDHPTAHNGAARDAHHIWLMHRQRKAVRRNGSCQPSARRATTSARRQARPRHPDGHTFATRPHRACGERDNEP